MTRYDFDEVGPAMAEHPEGEWVRWEDVDEALDLLSRVHAWDQSEGTTDDLVLICRAAEACLEKHGRKP